MQEKMEKRSNMKERKVIKINKCIQLYTYYSKLLAVQHQNLSGACFWEGFLLVLDWDLARLLQLFMWLRYV